MRTTQAQLDGTAERLNAMFQARGSSARVITEGRNGHYGLDLVQTIIPGEITGNIQKTLTVGTKSEVWNYMHAMMEALWLLEEPYVS